MNPTASPSGPGSREISFNVIGEAFEVMKVQWQPYVIASFIAMIGIGIAYALAIVLMGVLITVLAGVLGEGSMLVILPAYLAVGLLIVAVASGLMGGLMKMSLRTWRGESVQAGDIMQGLSMFGPLAITAILVYLGTYIGSLLCLIPGLIFAGVTLFAMPLVVDKRMAPVAAIKESIEMLKPYMLMAILFAIVVSLVMQLGAIACGIGMLFTMPLGILALTKQYLNFTGETATASGPTNYPRGDMAAPAAAPVTEPTPEPPADENPEAPNQG